MIEDIAEVAYEYLGIREQGGENMGFDNPEFQSAMQKAGWQRGYAWCAIFAELCVRRVLGDEHELTKAMLPSVLRTYSNFDKNYPGMLQSHPAKGAIVMWQTGQTTGHMGIVYQVLKDGKFLTIEGNSDDKVSLKRRNIYKQRKNWNLLGFIRIPDVYFK